VSCGRFAVSLAIVLSATVALSGQQRNVAFQLPAPTGKYPVGRRSFTSMDVARSMRPVKVDLWYPSEPSTTPVGTYLPDLDVLLKSAATAGAIEDRLGSALAGIAAGTVRSNAHEDAQIAQNTKPFPLLLFSHGLGGSPYDYSIQLEDLASHGYVVAAVEHIHDSLGVVLPDGSVVAFDGQLWARYASPSSPETVRFYEQRATVWAEDLLFARQQLVVLSSDKRSPLYDAIDFRRIGAFGHSHGGRSAATACMLDSRIKACLNEDGRLDEPQLQRPYWPLSGHEIRGVFAMLDWFDSGLDEEDMAGMHTTPTDYARARLKATGTVLEAYRGAKSGSYHYTMLRRGMSHTAFTDLRWLTASSEANRARYSEYLDVIRRTVRAFFDHTLKDEPARLEDCDSLDEGILTQCYTPTGKR
jgi:predicted dienelactone hydrolase